MTKDILEGAKIAFKKVSEHLKSEYIWLQAGQASPAMVENILTDSYGQKMPIKALASITIPESQQILITPWDKSVMSAIEKAIRDSSLELNPQNDWTAIRIIIPRLTEERRKSLVKIVHSKLEEAKISVRQVRQDSKSKLEKLEKDKQIWEDELRTSETHLQNYVNDANKELDELAKKKESDVMKV